MLHAGNRSCRSDHVDMQAQASINRRWHHSGESVRWQPRARRSREEGWCVLTTTSTPWTIIRYTSMSKKKSYAHPYIHINGTETHLSLLGFLNTGPWWTSITFMYHQEHTNCNSMRYSSRAVSDQKAHRWEVKTNQQITGGKKHMPLHQQTR